MINGMGCNRWISGGFLNQVEWDKGDIGVNKWSGQSKQDRVVKWIWGELNMWGANQLRTWGILVKEDSSFINTERKKQTTVTYSRSIHPSIHLSVCNVSIMERMTDTQPKVQGARQEVTMISLSIFKSIHCVQPWFDRNMCTCTCCPRWPQLRANARQRVFLEHWIKKQPPCLCAHEGGKSCEDSSALPGSIYSIQLNVLLLLLL